MATFPDASMTALYVIDLFEPESGAIQGFDTSYEPMMGTQSWYDRAEELADELLTEVREIAAEHDREIDTETDIGEPGRIIVAFADEEDVDHVVMGAHGWETGSRVLLGSVAELVARRSPVPVTLVR